MTDIIKFLEELKEKHISDGVMNENEYLTRSGMLDYDYIRKSTGIYVGNADMTLAVRQVFGTVKFYNIKRAINEVSREDFFAEYEFGRYLDTKDWTKYFKAKYDKVLTVGAIHEYLLK